MGKIIKRILQLPQKEWYRLFTKTKEAIYFESNPDFSDNARALFDYMIENGYNKRYKIYWASNSENHEIKNIENVSIISKQDKKEVVKTLYSCKYVFYTHGLSGWIREKKNQIIVNLWHGCGYKASRNKGKSKKFNIKAIINSGKMIFDYVLVPGNVFIKTKSEFFQCDKEKVIPYGYPRYDLLNKDYGNKDKISNAWNIKNRKVIMWMPTYRQTGDNSYKENNMSNTYWLPLLTSDEDLEKLNKICKDNNIFLVIKKHRSQKIFMKYTMKDSSINFIDDSDLEKLNVQLYNILQYTDALLTDYSSVAVDYLLLDKPLGFTLDDYEEYAKLRGFVFDNALEYMPGHHIYNIEDLQRFISDISENKDLFKGRREMVMPEMHNSCDNYCKRIIQKLGI